MAILVTGGAGYIGSHAVHMLIERGYEVVVFDNLASGHRSAIHCDATFVQGDLLNRAEVAALFQQHEFDGILHFASRIFVGESMQQPFMYFRENTITTLNLLEAAVQAGVKRFILSSTANLFDEPQRIPIDEQEPVIPGSVYGETKYWGERLLAWMDRIYGLKYCVLRYFNACGAHPTGHIGEDHDPEYHLIPLVLQVALGQRESITIFGDDYPTPDGTCIRDYVHVQDLAAAHIEALEILHENESRVYNLGSGIGYSVLEIIETARKVTGHPIPAHVGEQRPGDMAVLVADSQRIREELGWEPMHSSLENIMETAWNWHRKHPHGFEE